MNGVLSIEVYGYASYSVTMPQDTPDAEKWTARAGTDGTYQQLPLEGVAANTAVSVKYSGTKMVKSVKAKKKAAAPSVPDGAINGKFSVSDTKQVYFSKGNLRYASGTWSFFDNQYDYYNSYSADAWDHFGWSASATTYGMNTSTNTSTYSGNFMDWGSNSDLQTALGTGWFTLSSAEWTYLFNTRTVNGGTGSGKSYTLGQSVNSKPGVVIYPDNYTGEVYSGSDWATFESAGCVFLPIAGLRSGTNFIGGNRGCYWSSTICSADDCYYVNFDTGAVQPQINSNRRYGLSVRLVREVATSDAAPTGKTVELSTLEGDYEAQNGDVLTGVTTSHKVTIAAGATVTLDGVTISRSSYCIKCLGDATIILKDGSTNTLTGTGDEYPALSIGDANTTLTIQGSTGVLNVTSGMFCAGIGGGFSNTNYTCGNIRIEGGVITAQGGIGGAGIGSDSGVNCGDIIITGGTITAKGGTGAAGIGTGNGSANPDVCGNITIANTVTKVTATAGEDAPYSIGKGSGGDATCGTITIGGTKYWENNAPENGGNTYLAQSPLIYDPTAAKTDLLSGVFSVSASKKVNFSKGNLRYASSKWSFFDNQYDYYTSYSADAWDHFGWSTSATTYGMNTSSNSSDYSGDFVDWGSNSDLQTALGTGWFTLSKDEWTYLFNTRSASTVGGTENGRYAKAKVNDVGGVILFPDTYTHPDGVTAPTGVNATNDTGWNGNSYTVADWTKMESAGCVFLPATGYRTELTMTDPGKVGRYWSATLSSTTGAYTEYFYSNSLNPAYTRSRIYGQSVRLVKATSEAAAPAGPPSWKLTLSSPAKDLYITANGGLIAQHTLDVASTEFTVEMPELTSQTVNIVATDGSGNCWYCTQENMSFAIGQTYQSSPTMTAVGTSSSAAVYKMTGAGTIPAGKTAVLSGVTFSSTISCNGDATIILMGNNTLNGGLQASPSGNTMTITGTGSLNASGSDFNPGIGAFGDNNCGNIIICGGTITAQPGNSVSQAAGIGSGEEGTCGNITICGGTVTATGWVDGAGIGSGLMACGTVTITDGATKVTATGGNSAENSIGKGDGSCGTVTIDGVVNATISSTFEHFNSAVSGSTWTLTHK